MFFNSWLQEIKAFRNETEGWEPADELSRKIKGIFSEFSGSMQIEVEKLSKDYETRHAQQMQLEMALCFTGDAVSITNLTGEIRLVNPAFEHLTGHSGDKIIGSTHDLLWKNTPADKIGLMKANLKRGNTWRGELNLLTASGESMIAEVTAVPVISPKGEITHHIFMVRDVTLREKMKLRLIEQKEFLEKVVNLTSNLIIILGSRGGWKMDNLAAKTLIVDMGKGAREKLALRLFEEIQRKNVPSTRDIEIEIPGQMKRHYLFQSERIPARYLLPQEDDGLLYLITLSDITGVERKNREILIRERALSALRLERNLAQEELASGFVYQIKQPLNLLKAGQKRIAEQVKGLSVAGLQENVDFLRDNLDSMEQNLRQFKEITSHQDATEGSSSAAELAESILVLYSERCASERIALNIEEAGKDVTFPLSLEVMQMLAIMLLDNAVESCVSGEGERRIAVSFQGNDYENNLVVGDSGTGIKPENRFRVFEPFYTTKEGKQGLSLALLHNVVNKGGGRVRLNASPLGGAEFTLSFPLGKKS